MAHRRASRYEKMRRLYGIVLLFLVVGIIGIINANLRSSAARTDNGIAEIVDCGSVAKKSSLYNAQNNLGSLGMFGAIAFTGVITDNGNTSFNGGVATASINGTQNAFGYGEGQNHAAIATYLGSATESGQFLSYNTDFTNENSILVVGSGVSVTAPSGGYNQYDPKYVVAGTELPASKFAHGDFSTPVNATTHIYKEDTTAFLNLSALKASAITLNQSLASDYSTDQNVSISDNHITTSGAGVAVYNTVLTSTWLGGYEVAIGTANQTLIINIDMMNMQSWDEPQIGAINVTHNGNSNVIVNIYKSNESDKQYGGKITIGNGNVFTLAPSATFKTWGYAGSVIADKIAQFQSQWGVAPRMFYGNFPVAVPAESFGVCDDGGDAPVGQHKLTVKHYYDGEDEPFDSSFTMIDDGQPYQAEPVSVSYLTYKGLHAGSAAISGDSITDDIEVGLDYTVNDVTFIIEHRSTAEGNDLIESQSVTVNALEPYTVTSKKYDNFKYKNASGSLSQTQARNFGDKITLYYDPWQDPAEIVTQDMQYEKTPYYVESRLGTMGGFHMVGFEEIDANVRVYGNILTNKVTNMNEFGLVHFPLINYAKEVGGGITNPKFSPNDSVNTVLVVGKDVDIDLADNGNRWTILGAKVDIPQVRRDDTHTNLWREKDVQFIDLNGIKNDTLALSRLLASYSDDISTEKDFDDMNAKKINALNDNGLNVINLTYQDFDESHDIWVEGFDKDKKSTLVVNIDMAGFVGDPSYYDGAFVFAGTRLRWTNGEVYEEGYTGGENITREDAKLNNTITLNFIDSSSSDGLYHGHVASARPMLAYVLIPEGRFTILSSTFAGAILANRISGTGNSYMILFDHAFYVPEIPDTSDDVLTFILFGAICGTILALGLVKLQIKMSGRE